MLIIHLLWAEEEILLVLVEVQEEVEAEPKYLQ